MTVKLVRNKITPSLKRVKSRLAEIPKIAYNHWIANTPKDQGNARDKTKLNGDIIHADYPYATYLDKGASRQAPRGMSKPTSERVKQYTDQSMRK